MSRYIHSLNESTSLIVVITMISSGRRFVRILSLNKDTNSPTIMISINVIGDLISGSYGNTPFSRTYEKDIYEQMVKLADDADQAATVEEYNGILAEFSLLTTEDLKTRRHVADIAGDIYMSKDSAGRYFMELADGYLLDTPMPESLVDRILDSFDTGADTTPLAKLWLRWLRNPILRKKSKKGKGEEFTKRFFEFIDMKYVHPDSRLSTWRSTD